MDLVLQTNMLLVYSHDSAKDPGPPLDVNDDKGSWPVAHEPVSIALEHVKRTYGGSNEIKRQAIVVRAFGEEAAMCGTACCHGGVVQHR